MTESCFFRLFLYRRNRDFGDESDYYDFFGRGELMYAMDMLLNYKLS